MAKSLLANLLAFDRKTFREETGREPVKPRGSRGKSAKGDQLKLFDSAYTYIVGVDEVGRGCLAGPVVACAVMLPVVETRSALAAKLAALNDSKQIPPAVREDLRATICASSYFCVAEASVAEIDEINILNASLLAMKRAVDELLTKLPMVGEEVLVLVDGNKRIKECQLLQKTVVQGDSRSASIAAASVVAKVYRDKLMAELHEGCPQYLWHQNKGYGSKVHRQAIIDHGITVWHRQSFRLLPDEDVAIEEETELDVDKNLVEELEEALLEGAV